MTTDSGVKEGKKEDTKEQIVAWWHQVPAMPELSVLGLTLENCPLCYHMIPLSIDSVFLSFIFSCPFYFMIFSSVSHVYLTLCLERHMVPEFAVRLLSCVVFGKLSSPF